MFIRRLEVGALPIEVARPLFESWLLHLANVRFGASQHSPAGTSKPWTFSFGDPLGPHFTITESELNVSLRNAVDAAVSEIVEIVNSALDRVEALDLGGHVVYQTEMKLQEFTFHGEGAIHLVRHLSDQRHVEGSRRLSDFVILDFETGLLEETPAGGLFLAPSSQIGVTAFSPGPTESDYTRHTASAIIELTAAICALATGRPVAYSIPLFSAEDGEAEAANHRRHDSSILQLARDSISLDVFANLTSLGGDDSFSRIRSSLLAYHAALKQTSADVATLLFVTSIEALISPRAGWGKRRVTARFIKSLLQICPDVIDGLMDREDVADAFAFIGRGNRGRRRQDFLSKVYDHRSLTSHMGVSPSPAGFAAIGASGGVRVAALSELARAAILGYLVAPRSSLIGHPGLEGSRQLPTEGYLAP